MKKSIIIVLVLTAILSSSVLGADWAQFRGPTRDGKSTETGLLKKWPEGGPKLIWSIKGELGYGFSSVSVSNGYLYTTGMVGTDGLVFAYDLGGNFKWKTVYGPDWRGSHRGARTTPTVDGGRLYVMSGYGVIACIDSLTGETIWSVDTMKVFGAKNIKWGISESVLIDGKKVICTPGGKDATVVALDKMTGKTIWTTKGLMTDEGEGEKSSYCAPQIIKDGDRRLILTTVQESIVLIEPETGEVVIRIPHETRHDLSACSPIFDKKRIYATSGYGKPAYPARGKMFQLSDDLTEFKQVWTERNLDCHHGGLLFLDGKIHGTNSVVYMKPDPGTWFCLDLESGKIEYSDRLVGKGSVIYADGMMYCYGEKGNVGLVKIKKDGYEMVSSFRAATTEELQWSHPVISDGRLYIRYFDSLNVYDIKE